MSTHVSTLNGKREVYETSSENDRQHKYEDIEMSVTRFYGGKERGVSIQLTFDNGYIQLDNETAKLLAKQILESLEEY